MEEERHPLAQPIEEERAIERNIAAMLEKLKQSPNYLGKCGWCYGPVMTHQGAAFRDGVWWHAMCKKRDETGNGIWRISHGISDLIIKADRYCGDISIADDDARWQITICGDGGVLEALRDCLTEVCIEQRAYDDEQRVEVEEE